MDRATARLSFISVMLAVVCIAVLGMAIAFGFGSPADTALADPEKSVNVSALHPITNNMVEQGTTIIIVTHDPRIGESTKRCIRILDGQLQE